MQVFRLRFTRTKRIAIEKARQEIVTAKAAIDSLSTQPKKDIASSVRAQDDYVLFVCLAFPKSSEPMSGFQKSASKFHEPPDSRLRLEKPWLIAEMRNGIMAAKKASILNPTHSPAGYRAGHGIFSRL